MVKGSAENLMAEEKIKSKIKENQNCRIGGGWKIDPRYSTTLKDREREMGEE